MISVISVISVISEEAVNANFIIPTWPRLEPPIYYHARSEHGNHCTTDTVQYFRYIHHNKITHNNVCKYKRAQWWEIRLQPERGDIVDSMGKFCLSVGYQGQLMTTRNGRNFLLRIFSNNIALINVPVLWHVMRPLRSCNKKRSRLEYGRSWVRYSVRRSQRQATG